MSVFQHPLWSDSGTWIAVGVTAISIIGAVVMERCIVEVLKLPPSQNDQQDPS